MSSSTCKRIPAAIKWSSFAPPSCDSWRGMGGGRGRSRLGVIFTGSPVSRNGFKKQSERFQSTGAAVAEAGLSYGRIGESTKSRVERAASIRLEERLLSSSQPPYAHRGSGWLDCALSSSWLRGILSYSLLRPWAARLPFLVSTEEEQAGVLINSLTIRQKIATSSSVDETPVGSLQLAGLASFLTSRRTTPRGRLQ